jgi:hypothetical protein
MKQLQVRPCGGLQVKVRRAQPWAGWYWLCPYGCSGEYDTHAEALEKALAHVGRHFTVEAL